MDRREHEQQYANSQKLAARARLFQYAEEEVPWPVWVATHAGLKAGDRVLEVGCGPGWFWGAVADALPPDLELTLTDLSPGMVEEAAAKVGGLNRYRLQTAVADIVDLPFPNERFDAAIAMHMFYHVSDPARGMAELARVLKPGGKAIITTNGLNDSRGFYALGARAFGGPPVNPAAVTFGFEQAQNLLKATFGNVTCAPHPSRLRITDPQHVFDALTSYPPGDGAPEEQLAELKVAIAEAFEAGGGALVVEKESGVFVSQKAG
jgi:SAM-dependent methyltransferase